MGWGSTTEGGIGSNILREVDLPIITNQECNEAHWGGIYESMICAFDSGKDSCQGDSGESLRSPGASTDTDTLIGVVAWGSGCEREYLGVYARVSNAYEWIKTQVCSLSSSPPNQFSCSIPTSKPPMSKPITKPPTNKPTNNFPTNQPTTIKPTSLRPTTKPPTTRPNAKPPQTNLLLSPPQTNLLLSLPQANLPSPPQANQLLSPTQANQLLSPPQTYLQQTCLLV
ncbi:hypothetical protein ACHAW6_002379 [Cyclotella cf. meneghiniana]